MRLLFSSVRPKPRTIPVTVINKGMETRLQAIDKKVHNTFVEHKTK